MDFKQKLSIANLILSALIIGGAIWYKDIMLGTLGLFFLIFSIYRYKANFGVN